MLIRYGQQRAEAWRPNSASHEILILEYIVAARVPIERAAESAKQYVTGKSAVRLHSAATDAMLEGRPAARRRKS